MSEQRQSIGAWKKQTSKGEVINFTINGQKYSMWPNTRKTAEKQPDFNIVPDNYQPQPQSSGSQPVKKDTFTDDTSNLPF